MRKPAPEMADYKPSAATTAVLQPIYRYTARTFGSRQAESHAGGLKQTFETLAEFPRTGKLAQDLRSGLFRFPFQSHIIFYTIEPTHIVIRRVLHDRMDFATRI